MRQLCAGRQSEVAATEENESWEISLFTIDLHKGREADYLCASVYACHRQRDPRVEARCSGELGHVQRVFQIVKQLPRFRARYHLRSIDVHLL